MTDDLPAPLTPPDCDLRDFGFMPLEIERLRRSSAWRRAKRKPALAFYMVNLWAGAFHEVPAGSIEDDDDAQADIADCDLRRWRTIKANILTGWVKCSDGRLYHRVVAEKALEAWIEKLGQRKSGAIGNAKRWKCTLDVQELDKKITTASELLRAINQNSRTLVKKTVQTVGIRVPDPIAEGSPPDPDPIAEGSQGTGTGKKKKEVVPSSEEEDGQAPPAAPNKGDTKNGKPSDPWAEVYRRGKEILGQNAGGTITLLRHLFDQKPRKVLAKIEDAAEQRQPVPWINAFLWANTERLPPGSHVGPVAPMA